MDLFALSARITLNTEDYEESLKNASSKTSTFGDILKANLTSEAIISGVKKLASVVGEIGKAAYISYSEYEQLAGGAGLMFGDAYNAVAQNAKNAYKTVQMSQNEYLAQVNGLATGLKTALGGNAEAAAELAHKVLTAEADVVAATGNTQEAVQNAFNGIMKSNYTMLDNLQLGITPTKEGFRQLIDKVNEWNAANGRATNYTIDNVADAQAALVDYIEMQGLAGYAANEAAGTIQGSTASMKAAWENLASGMADETADMEELTQNFVDSVGTAAKNILPKVQQIVAGVGTATVEGISYLRETNEAIDSVITVVEDVGIAVATLTAGFTLQKIVTGFGEARVAISLLTLEVGKANIEQQALNGTLTIGEIITGLLTGQISGTTLATQAWEAAQLKVNTAMNANPIGVLIGLIGALTIVVNKSRKHVSDLAGSYVKQADSAAECAKNLEDLKTRYAELTNGENNPNKWAAENRTEITALGQAIEQTEAQLIDLTDAETTAAISSKELSSQSLRDAEILEEAAQTYADAVQGIMEDYYDTYGTIYDGIHNVASAFTKVTEATEITWAKAMENMSANTQLLENMDENFEYISRGASDARIDISGFSEMLASMGTEDAAGLLGALRDQLEKVGPTSGDAVKTLTELSDAISGYSTAGTDYSQSLALIVEDVSGRIAEATKNYEDAVGELDQAAEATEAGKNTMQGLLNGIQSETPRVLSTVDSLADQMKSRLQTSFSGFVLNIQANVTANGSHKTGLDYVPFDGYIAELHKGEQVLTAEEAAARRSDKGSNGNSGGIVINQYIQAPVESPAELAAATEAYFQQARWSL